MVKVAMVNVLRVRDVMTRSVHTLDASLLVDEAIAALGAWHVSGAPVLQAGRLVGVVSRSDLHGPPATPRDGQVTAVADVMTPVVYAVREADPAILAARLMVDEHIHRVIALDDQGVVTGIVTSMDLVEAIAYGWASREAREAAPRDDLAIEYVDLRRLATRST